jgi:tRNA pseudouridine(55) synthase
MNGALIIDKPAGLTFDVIARVRKIIGERRVSHETLDPFATGVLVVLVGRATRLAQFWRCEKEYEATIRLGYATDTGDLTGARCQQFTTACHRVSPRRNGDGDGVASGDIEQPRRCIQRRSWVAKL